MKVYLIRHARVDMVWPPKCDAKEFDNACKKYDLAGIIDSDIFPIDVECRRIYVSNMLRSRFTACKLFPEREYCEIEIHEVPLRSFTDSTFVLPLWMWNIMGRLQWFFNSRRQIESKTETEKRCEKVIRQLEEKKEDCAMVAHGFFMRSFIKILEKRGYTIKGHGIGISNLQIVAAEKF